MKNLLALCAAVLLAACAHGKTTDFPAAADPANAAQVYVIRNNNLFGWGLSVAVTLNEVAIAHLQAGEHIALRLPPGQQPGHVPVEEHQRVHQAVLERGAHGRVDRWWQQF